MVQLSATLLRWTRRHPIHSSPFFGRTGTDTPDQYDRRWKTRKTFLLSAHLYGKARNCWKVAEVQHKTALWREVKCARHKADDKANLLQLRIEAGAHELGFDGWRLREALTRSHLHLSDKMLAELAAWEPRSFRSVIGIAAHKASTAEEEGGMGMPACGPGTRVHVGKDKL